MKSAKFFSSYDVRSVIVTPAIMATMDPAHSCLLLKNGLRVIFCQIILGMCSAHYVAIYFAFGGD
jgi:flagellar biosynthesis protein FliR